jgi:hypothetical protein
LFVCLPKFSSGINERHLKLKILSCIELFFSAVSDNGTEHSALWDTPQEIRLWWGIQRKKNCSGVGYNRKKPSSLWDSTEETSQTS